MKSTNCMNAILVHYKYERPNSYTRKFPEWPLLINVDSIVSIEPDHTHGDEDGTIIVTNVREYIVKESYKNIVNTMLDDGTLKY